MILRPLRFADKTAHRLVLFGLPDAHFRSCRFGANPPLPQYPELSKISPTSWQDWNRAQYIGRSVITDLLATQHVDHCVTPAPSDGEAVFTVAIKEHPSDHWCTGCCSASVLHHRRSRLHGGSMVCTGRTSDRSTTTSPSTIAVFMPSPRRRNRSPAATKRSA